MRENVQRDLSSRTTIESLILAERSQSGASYRELASRAERSGFSLKFQYLNELAKSGPKGWPKKSDTFRALAAVLRLPVRTVILAYASSLGLNVDDPGSKLAEQLPDNTQNISPAMTEALLQLIRAASSPSSSQE